MKALLALAVFVLACGPCAGESGSEPSRLGLGANYLGGQVDYSLSRAHRLELRYQRGSAASDAGEVRSEIVGLRGYRLFRIDARDRPYFGGELAFVQAGAGGSSYKVSGAAAGLFVGLERRLAARFYFGADLGVYLFSLREKRTGVNSTSVDVAANSYALFYVF